MSDQTNSAESARAVSTAAETREQIVQAAVEVFLERGYDQVRVQDITRRAGYTTGALYAHFESRTSILAEAISRQGAGLVQDMIRAVGDARPGDGSLLRGLANLICAEPQPLDKLMTEAMALAARLVMMLIPQFTAFDPQIAAPGPRITSMRSMSSIIVSWASQNVPEKSGEYTLRPSTRTRQPNGD